MPSLTILIQISYDSEEEIEAIGRMSLQNATKAQDRLSSAEFPQ